MTRGPINKGNPPAAIPQEYLSVTDFAALCGLSTKTMRRRISDGTINARRIGSLIRIHRDELADLGRPIPSVKST